jgi:hypothetical protein
VQARLAGLAPDARRLLRAASVLGERFRPEALTAMRGADSDAGDPLAVLDRLRREELVLSPSDERDGGAEWSFRHSLVRQAAYEMLTAEDRASAHRAAAQWLATRSNSDPATIAEHYEKAGAMREAGPWFLRAIEAREELGDYEAVSAFASRADRDEVEPDLRADIVFQGSYADMFLGRYDVLALIDKRLEDGQFPRGSSGWASLMASSAAMKIHGGIPVDIRAVLEEITASRAVINPSIASIFTLCLLVVSLVHIGMLEEARQTAAMLTSITDRPETPRGWIALRDSYLPWLTAVDDDPESLAVHRAAVHLARTHCSPARQQEIITPYISFLMEFGAEREAREWLAAADLDMKRIGVPINDFYLLGEAAIATLGERPVECSAILERRTSPEWKHVDLWLRASCVASASLADPTNLDAARAAMPQLDAIADESGPLLTQRNIALTLLATCALHAGEPARALAAIDRIRANTEVLLPGMRTRVSLARMRALKQLGQREECAREASLARSRITLFANGLSAEDRALFLDAPSTRELLAFEP